MTLFSVLTSIAKILGFIALGLIGAGGFLCILIGIVFVLNCWRDFK